jgi:hypothetical protein
MASARLKPRTNIATPKRRSRTVHQSVGSQRTNARVERADGGLPVFGSALLVLAALGLAMITGFMA